MSRIEALIKRMRPREENSSGERVLIDDQLETLTHTQAGRFQHLQRLHAMERKQAGAPAPKPYYSLPEAGRRLGLPVNRLLQLAAAGKLTCLLSAGGLRGTWSDPARAADEPAPQYLALLPASCGEIETWSSANVAALEHPEAAGLHLQLHEPLWVGPAMIVLKHPLPDCHTT